MKRSIATDSQRFFKNYFDRFLLRFNQIENNGHGKDIAEMNETIQNQSPRGVL